MKSYIVRFEDIFFSIFWNKFHNKNSIIVANAVISLIWFSLLREYRKQDYAIESDNTVTISHCRL